MSIATSFIEQIAERLVTEDKCFCPHGNRTKPALLGCSRKEPTEPTEQIDLREHTGIVTYDPSEFLITARSGTTVRAMTEVLSEHGQYLPFDPLFSSVGSTLGGSVAAGISGPGRLLYGGIRDFVMEVELLDGLGKLIRGGGKVVKNAAGFDLPKLLVGSYGRLGILTEITLKVFPRPAAFATLSFPCSTIAQCVSLSQVLQSKPLPISALDFGAAHAASGPALHVRFAGPVEALPNVLERALKLSKADGVISQADDDTALWTRQAAFVESPGSDCVVRIATNLHQASELVKILEEIDPPTQLLFSAGGAVAYLHVASASLAAVDRLLLGLRLPGIILRRSEQTSESGEQLDTPYLGDQVWRSAARRIQQAMDPNGRFISF